MRESTGILLYGFGGVGLTNYSVKANYENGIFGDYNYLSIDNSQSPNEIVDDLDRMLDNSYETTIKERGTDLCLLLVLVLDISSLTIFQWD